jgi:hypothetical protein
MSIEKINLRNSTLILMIIGAAATRLLNISHIATWANFTPVGAVALFGGTYFTDKWKAYLVPLVTLFISDLALSYVYFGKLVFFYDGIIPVYISFGIMVLIGTFIKKVSFVNVAVGLLAGVLVHWLLTDCPFIQIVPLYPKTLAGYGASLIAAIPFEKNMVLGDLVFGLILFGGFELAKRRYTFLRTEQELAV